MNIEINVLRLLASLAGFIVFLMTVRWCSRQPCRVEERKPLRQQTQFRALFGLAVLCVLVGGPFAGGLNEGNAKTIVRSVFLFFGETVVALTLLQNGFRLFDEKEVR
jgi:hypothetical protein